MLRIICAASLLLTLSAHADTITGDCNGDGSVEVNELVLSVNVALGMSPLTDCPAIQCDPPEPPAITCLIAAVNDALDAIDPVGP